MTKSVQAGEHGPPLAPKDAALVVLQVVRCDLSHHLLEARCERPRQSSATIVARRPRPADHVSKADLHRSCPLGAELLAEQAQQPIGRLCSCCVAKEVTQRADLRVSTQRMMHTCRRVRADTKCAREPTQIEERRAAVDRSPLTGPPADDAVEGRMEDAASPIWQDRVDGVPLEHTRRRAAPRLWQERRCRRRIPIIAQPLRTTLEGIAGPRAGETLRGNEGSCS
mmetsp:Transcript_3893/g.11589  ORF Transcript_3893/g.11589 Transcript_3893/m.11589 type:complete len:225 (+) Transcript_3893:220-894(+)